MAYDTYTITVKLSDRGKADRWSYKKEARNVEATVREALRQEYGKPVVMGVKVSQEDPTLTQV